MTTSYAPVGQLLSDGDNVCCHLCGRWFLSVASHLRSHEWTKADYISTFGLERSNPLTGDATRRRRAAALRARSRHEPAIRAAQAMARERARTGALSEAAARAARGRAHSPERRPKTLAALSAIKPEARAAANAHRAQLQREQTASNVASAFGFDTFAAYAIDRLDAGLSLAAISREAGLHKDWVGRHLRSVAPQALAAWQQRCTDDVADQRWGPTLADAGFDDLATFLRTRHLVQRQTVAAIALESGRSRPTVLAAMARHSITPTPHIAKRSRAADRSTGLANQAGFDSIAAFITARRADEASWRAMATEIGLPESTLRRHERKSVSPAR